MLTGEKMTKSLDNGFDYLYLDMRIKDELTKEVMLVQHVYTFTENELPYTQERLAVAKSILFQLLLDHMHRHGMSTNDISDIRRCDVLVVPKGTCDYFANVTFAEAVFVYKTLFCDIDRSLYSNALVKKLAGKELDAMQLECKRALLDEKSKMEKCKQDERDDVEHWYKAELDKLMSKKKKAVRKEISESMLAFMKSNVA